MEPRVPPTSFPRRLWLWLILLLVLAACSIEDPAGTWWDTPFFLSAEPETLRVQNAANGQQVDFTGPDSLILFLQELVPIRFGLGDSLSWSGVISQRDVHLDTLRLASLGSASADVPLTLAFPDLASLVGGSHQITERLPFLLDIPLPPFSTYEWIAFQGGLARLQGQHAWPFNLEALHFHLMNLDGAVLGEGDLSTLGAFPAGTLLQAALTLAGRASPQLVLRISSRTLPMTAPALVTNSALTLGLYLDGGTADSALALLPGQELRLRDAVFTDSSLRIDEALSRDQDLELVVRNDMDVPVDLRVIFPEITVEHTGDTLRLDVIGLAPGAVRIVRLDNQALRIRPLAGNPEHTLQLHVDGSTQPGAGFTRLGITDRVAMGLLLAPAHLDYFRGEFAQDHGVPVNDSSQDVEDFPPELEYLVLRNLAMHLVLQNPLQVEFTIDMDMLVHSSAGYADTTFRVTGMAEGDRDRVILPGMGLFLQRIPRDVRFNGELLILKDRPVELWSDSEINLVRMEVPGRLRVVDALWHSQPELSGADLPREVLEAEAVLFVESTIPLGGTLSAWLSAGGNVAGDTSTAVRALPDIQLEDAPWDGDGSLIVRDTLRLPLTAEALEFLRGGHWQEGRFVEAPGAAADWWGWYRFRARSGEDTVSVRRDQELRVQGRIEIRARLGGE